MAKAAQPRPENEIAHIIEHSRMTGWGVFWTVLFVISTLITMVGSASATTVFQQIASGVSWLGSLLLYGIAFMTCRRRTYTIYRTGN